MFLDFVCPSPKSSHGSTHKSLFYLVRVFSSFLFLTSLPFYYRLKINFLLFFYIFDVRLLSLLIQVNVFSSHTLFDNSVVVAVILLFIRCLYRVYLLPNCFTHFLTFGDQISVVYHSISSLVCIVVSSGIFWSFQTRVVNGSILDTTISLRPIASKITDIFWDHSS
jgi:hypothetical protein